VKKYILLLVVSSAVFCLYAQNSGGYFFGAVLDYLDNPDVTTQHLDRKRIVDIRLLNLDAALGNNLVGIFDIFAKEILVDIDELNDRIDDSGARFGFSVNTTPLQININPTERWGGGIGTGVSSRLDIKIPKDLLTLIAEGNYSKPKSSGEFALSGSAFYEIAANAHGTLPFFDGKLTVGLDPSYYVPLFYIPRSSVNYELDTEDKILVKADGKFRAYAPSNFSDGDFGIFGSGGVDISLAAEYALFTRLDLGLTLSHIPLIPASLTSGFNLSVSPDDPDGYIIKIEDLMEDLDNFKINTPEITGGSDFRTDLPALTIFRPMRFDFYANYRPFSNDFFTVRPNIGFTALNASEETYFNFGTRVTLSLARIFDLYLDSGLEEDYWRHKLGFVLNLRAFEFDLEAGLRSQSLDSSVTASGASVKMALAFGW
jgi:hypothetical protein